jgi:hypothetical protein
MIFRGKGNKKDCGLRIGDCGLEIADSLLTGIIPAKGKEQRAEGTARRFRYFNQRFRIGGAPFYMKVYGKDKVDIFSTTTTVAALPLCRFCALPVSRSSATVQETTCR